MDNELLQEFYAEADDLMEKLLRDLELLRQKYGRGKDRRELVAGIFRHIHTIKGSSAAAGLNPTSKIAHELETVLDGIRTGHIVVTEEILTLFDDAANELARSLKASEKYKPPQALLKRFKKTRSTEVVQSSPAELIPEEMAKTLGAVELQRVNEAISEGANLYVIKARFGLVDFDSGFRSLSERLSDAGELVSKSPTSDPEDPMSIIFTILYTSEETGESLLKISEEFTLSIEQLRSNTEVEEEEESEEEATETRPQSISSLSPTVRVQLEDLDGLVASTHDLLNDVTSSFNLALSADLKGAERTEMEIRSTRIRRHFLELEQRLIEQRMIPVSQTLQRAAMAAQSAAREAGREVKIDIQGGEVRLDKSLADGIADPLLHLTRNAVDHGIEKPEKRLEAGKAETGHVILEALSEGSRVLIRVSDDGAGLDVERIRRVAIERGVIKEDTPLTEQQCLDVIFSPGFSTAASVSSISGRGVGLDVVEQTVKQFGGEIRVRSTRGFGSTFELDLPTTLSLIPSLVVRSEGFHYCIDASHIIETGYVGRDQIERIGLMEVIKWRDHIVPFVHLRSLLGQSNRPVEIEKIPIVLSRVAERGQQDLVTLSRGVAVAVDWWEGHRDVLVRGLGHHASRWQGIGGATELAEKDVALVLDLPRLIEMWSSFR
jgi:two-component system, chemotaxis family, sensor kinase CheA